MKKPSAAFEIAYIDVDIHTIYIVDTSDYHGTISVTNDAEQVVNFLYSKYPEYSYIYMDTLGNIDQLAYTGCGIFQYFKPLKQLTDYQF